MQSIKLLTEREKQPIVGIKSIKRRYADAKSALHQNNFSSHQHAFAALVHQRVASTYLRSKTFLNHHADHQDVKVMNPRKQDHINALPLERWCKQHGVVIEVSPYGSLLFKFNYK